MFDRSENQKRVDAFLAKGKSAVPTIQLAEPLPPLTPEERKFWDAKVLNDQTSDKQA